MLVGNIYFSLLIVPIACDNLVVMHINRFLSNDVNVICLNLYTVTLTS